MKSGNISKNTARCDHLKKIKALTKFSSTVEIFYSPTSASWPICGLMLNDETKSAKWNKGCAEASL